MAPAQPTRLAEEATPGFPMIDLENGETGHKPAFETSSTNSSSASSPTEAAYLTHTHDFVRAQTPSPSFHALAFLRRRTSPRLILLYENSASWVKGPRPSRVHKITPIFPQVQAAPLKLLDRWVPQYYQKSWLLIGYYILWLLLFVIILYRSASRDEVSQLGPPVKLSCISRLW